MRSDRRPTSLARVTLLAAAFAAGLPASAEKIVFSVVPAQSEIVIAADSALRFGFQVLPVVATSAFDAQGTPGATLPSGTPSDGRRTSLSGSIFADVVANTSIGFAARGTTLAAGNAGSFLPGLPAAIATPAPADLAVAATAASLGIAMKASMRDAIASIQAPTFAAPAALTPAGAGTWTFAGPVTVAFVEGALDLSDTGSGTTRRVYVGAGPAPSSSGGTLADLGGGVLRLTLPVDALLAIDDYQHGMGPTPIAGLALHVTGQIVAETVPEPSAALAAALAIALLLVLRGVRAPAAGRVALVLASAIFAMGGICDLETPPSGQTYFPGVDSGGLTEGTATVSGVDVVDSISSSFDENEVAENTDANGECRVWIDGLSFAKDAVDFGFWCECFIEGPSGLPAGGDISTTQSTSFSVFGNDHFDSSWAQTLDTNGVDGAGPMNATLNASVNCYEPATPNQDTGDVPESGSLQLSTPITNTDNATVFCSVTADFDCVATAVGHSIAYGHVFLNDFGDFSSPACHADEQCPTGQLCSDGACGGLPFFCDYESDCNGNGVTDQHCVAWTGGFSICSTGNPSDPCEIDSHCLEGNHCVDSGGATPTCTQGNPGDPCEDDVDCDGLACEQGLCT